MRLICSMLCLASCGAGLKQPDGRVKARDALVRASGNAAAIENLFDLSTIDGGMWFADAACRAQFAAAGKIAPDRFHAFAECLAGLHWQASERIDALGDTVLLTYTPGFEVEARIAQELRGPRLRWIGYTARRDAADALPTITPEALETVRTGGDRIPQLPPEVGNQLELDAAPGARSAYTWFKICIDEAGSVASVQERETTSLVASHVFGDVIAGWRFRPFMVGDEIVPVCAMVRLIYPQAHATETEVIPLPAPPSRNNRQPIIFAPGAKIIEAKRISGTRLIKPPEDTKQAILKSGVSPIVGSFRLCLDESGHVESVIPLKSTGFADYDRRLLAGIEAWVYSPFLVAGQPQPVCTEVTFIYSNH